VAGRAVLRTTNSESPYDVELRPLVGVDGVLDRQLVQVELLPSRIEIGDGRIQESNPRERVVALDRVVGVLDRQVARETAPVLVDRAIHDHTPIIAPERLL
jgi:hypothetical protein